MLWLFPEYSILDVKPAYDCGMENVKPEWKPIVPQQADCTFLTYDAIIVLIWTLKKIQKPQTSNCISFHC